MKVLVNIESRDRSHSQYLNYVMGSRGHDVVQTTKVLDRGGLLEAARLSGCTGIVVAHPKTLHNLVDTAPEKSITLDNFRGSRYMIGKTPCVITNPLWHMTKVKHGRWLFDSDVDKLEFGSWVGPKNVGEFIGSTGRLQYVLNEIDNAVLVAVDIETNGEEVDKYYSRKVGKEERANGIVETKPVYITSISFSLLRLDGSIYSYAVPIVDYDREYWSEFELQAVIAFMRKAVSTITPTVYHNGIYDILHLIQYRAWPKNYCFDTLGFQHGWYVELPKSLDFTASICCPDYQQWKFKSKLAHANHSIEDLMSYNMDDTYWTLRAAIHQLMFSPSWAMRNFLKTMKLVPSSTYAHFEGMHVDNEFRLKELERREAILVEKRRSLQVMTANEDFNPGSWQQKEHLFYVELGASKPKIGKSAACTDELNLLKVAQQHPLFARYVTAILDYQEQSKAIGTYLKFRQRNGKLMYQLSPWGTDTGRLASQASSFNCGTQVQNIPYYAKPQLVPPPGFTWVNIDYSKVEAVFTAYISEALKLIKAVTDSEKDFYKTLGTLFFNIPYPDVTTDLRNKVLKKIVHGSNYMMQGNTFINSAKAENLYVGAKELGVTITPNPVRGMDNCMTMIAFANMLLEKYHEPFPEVRRWYADTKKKLIQEGKLVSADGWTRLFFGDAGKDHAVLRSAVAHQPQGLGAEYMKKAVCAIWREVVLNPNWMGDVRYKAQVHDSWVGIVRTDRLVPALSLLRQHMLQTVTVHGREVVVPIDVEVSTKSYGDMVELEYDDRLGQYILPDVF